MAFDYRIIKTKISGLQVIINSSFKDNRGVIFTSSNSFIEKILGLNKFHNHHTKIMNRKKNSLTGLHGDNKSWKLLSCLEGSIKVVLIDLRKKSDEGFPLTEIMTNHKISKIFENIAKKIIKII